jgi:CubicO group peptidase (beta-lactamase class C family)
MNYFNQFSTRIVLVIVILSCISCTPKEEIIETLSGLEIEESRLDQFIEKQMDTLKITGLSVAVINDSKVVYYRVMGMANIDSSTKVTESTIFEAASLSKPVFAYFVMKLIEQNVLNIDTPLYKYLPYEDIAYDDRYKLITARMVLSHSTGFPNWRQFNPDGKLDIKSTPGTEYSYSSEAYEYLCMVVAHLTGRDLNNLEQLFQETVCKPLDIKNAYYVRKNKIDSSKAKGHIDGIPVEEPFWYNHSRFGAAGNLHTEAFEFSKFLIAILQEKGLSKETYQDIFSKQILIPKDEVTISYPGDVAWGLGFGIKDSPYGELYFHEGLNHGFQSYFMINRKTKNGYVFFTNCENAHGFMDNLESFLTNGIEKDYSGKY